MREMASHIPSLVSALGRGNPSAWPVYKPVGTLPWLMVDVEGPANCGGADPGQEAMGCMGNHSAGREQVSKQLFSVVLVLVPALASPSDGV